MAEFELKPQRSQITIPVLHRGCSQATSKEWLTLNDLVKEKGTITFVSHLTHCYYCKKKFPKELMKTRESLSRILIRIIEGQQPITMETYYNKNHGNQKRNEN